MAVHQIVAELDMLNEEVGVKAEHTDSVVNMTVVCEVLREDLLDSVVITDFLFILYNLIETKSFKRINYAYDFSRP